MLTRRQALKAGALGAAGAALGHSGAASRLLASAPVVNDLLERVIPSSGERLPVIGIGTARRYDTDSPDDKAVLREVIRRFPRMGGRLVDTAPSYGHAEAVVGELVRDTGTREDLFLATKVPLFDRPADRATGIRMMEESLRLLHTDYIDLMQVHNMQGFEALLPLLREWKAAGRIRYTGMSTSRDPEYPDFVRLMEREELDFIQVDYSIDNRTAADRILPLASDRGMAVLVNLPFGRTSVFERVAGRELPDWARELDCATWAQFFLKYIVSHPAVTCAIPGTATTAYLEDNLGAARGRMPDAGERRRMERFFDEL